MEMMTNTDLYQYWLNQAAIRETKFKFAQLTYAVVNLAPDKISKAMMDECRKDVRKAQQKYFYALEMVDQTQKQTTSGGK